MTAEEDQLKLLITVINEYNKLAYYQFISNIVLVTIMVIGILFAVEIIGFAIKRTFKKYRKFPHEAIGGFLNFIRMIAVFIMIFSVLVTFGIMDYDTLLNFTTIFSTAIGLASGIIVGNLIAGFFMMGSRPYSVGDYIKIGGSEGFVTEIGLNYTILRDSVGIGNIHKIPNKVAMGANLLNYKTFYKGDLSETPNEISKKEQIKVTMDKLLHRKKISRYIFTMEFELELDPQGLMVTLNEICDRWTPKFGFKPQIFFQNIYYRLTVRFLISSDDLGTAINLLPEFKKDIWFSVYGEKGGLI